MSKAKVLAVRGISELPETIRMKEISKEDHRPLWWHVLEAFKLYIKHYEGQKEAN